MNFVGSAEVLRVLFTLIIVYFHMIRVWLVELFPSLYGHHRDMVVGATSVFSKRSTYRILS
jgi:hypothetical protein